MDHTLVKVTSNPHIRSNKSSIERIMRDVIIALLPACILGVYFFGFNALLTLIVCVASCLFAEWIYEKIAKKPITIKDGSAVITGLLLGMNLPPTVPIWLPVVGSFFAIIIAKQLFGGLGHNFINPALAARAFLLASYPTEMTKWSVDATTSATQLGLMKESGFIPQTQDYINALIGLKGGCIGEVCAIAIILGGLYLMIRQVISWRIPVAYLGTFLILTALLKRTGYDATYPVYELLTGGLLLGAFFMATDYSSSPVTPLGQLIFGIGCAVLTVVIRFKGGYPEGVSYSILIMNLVVPYLDRFMKPKVYGEVK